MNKLNQIFKLIAFLLILMFTHQKLLAHHSAIAFDKTKSVTVTGKITRSVWRNPHMAINIDVADKDGNDIYKNKNGYYIIQDIAPGNYTIMVSYIGFDMYKQNTRLNDDESKKININFMFQTLQNHLKKVLISFLRNILN